MERTLAIIKPDAVRDGHTGEILATIEAAGFRIAALRRVWLTEAQAKAFYAVHEGKSFFDGLIGFMTEGPCVPVVLERDDAVNTWREVLLPIRAKFGRDQRYNAVHGSDAPETAAFEIACLFSGLEIA
ncbi:MAG: nucleoside-diphosphate kinase [Armatimonadetes bacterium]|nr:nucleoside-diphosphate kinase [Armatimonadota bacterium]